MRILIVGDIHMCPTSSIITGRGEKYSQRLENCINSINWCEELSNTKNCDAVVYLGDTFNTASLNDETITAVKELKWNDRIMHHFLVGNHESTENDLKFNSVNILKNADINITIFDKPEIIKYADLELAYLPYIPVKNQLPLQEYFGEMTTGKKRIIFSHNDLAGIQLGSFLSKNGFKLDDIQKYSSLFLNGHLHNGTWVVPGRIRNLGILTGKNFNENGDLYPHTVMILDTDTLQYEDVENPYAFNFYKLEINSPADIQRMSLLKNNLALYISYDTRYETELNEQLEKMKDKIVEVKQVPILNTIRLTTTTDISTLHEDHLAKLVEFCDIKFDHNEIIFAELEEICKN